MTALPPGVITWWRASIGVDDMVSSRPIFRGEDYSVGFDPPYRVHEKGRERAHRSGVLVNCLSPRSLNLFLRTPK